MAQINKPDDYFNTKLYTGTGSTQSITGVGFQPDMNWIKTRTRSGYNHCITDAVRGATKLLRPNLTASEATYSDSLTSFDSDGFSLGADSNGEQNKSGDSYVSWNWLGANASSSNTDGSITSTVSANTTSGFSIVKWSGSGANATIGHSLNSTPKMVITKSLGSSAWGVYNENLGNTKVLFLDTTAGESANVAYWNNTSPTSTVFSVGTDSAVNHSGNDMIAYCFAEKKGFSKFGSYVGINGGANGPFIYTGFKPAFILIKNTTSSADWHIRDNKRDTYNASTHFLKPNSSDAEVTSGEAIDILSNGFKIKANGLKVQDSGNTYIYMAFAENPLVGTNNIPATAR